MLVTGQPWRQEEHRHFPPAFKAAVRALLLAQRRGRPTVAGSQANPLSLLEPALLDIICRAAFPLSPWLPE